MATGSKNPAKYMNYKSRFYIHHCSPSANPPSSLPLILTLHFTLYTVVEKHSRQKYFVLNSKTVQCGHDLAAWLTLTILSLSI
jgi:hypothetical protein